MFLKLMCPYFSYTHSFVDGILEYNLSVNDNCPQNLFNQLVNKYNFSTLTMICCTEIKYLPSTIVLKKRLRYIYIDTCDELEYICSISYLRELDVFDCFKLKKICKMNSLDYISVANCYDLEDIEEMEKITEARVYNCPKMF